MFKSHRKVDEKCIHGFHLPLSREICKQFHPETSGVHGGRAGGFLPLGAAVQQCSKSESKFKKNFEIWL